MHRKRSKLPFFSLTLVFGQGSNSQDKQTQSHQTFCLVCFFLEHRRQWSWLRPLPSCRLPAAHHWLPQQPLANRHSARQIGFYTRRCILDKPNHLGWSQQQFLSASLSHSQEAILCKQCVLVQNPWYRCKCILCWKPLNMPALCSQLQWMTF